MCVSNAAHTMCVVFNLKEKRTLHEQNKSEKNSQKAQQTATENLCNNDGKRLARRVNQVKQFQPANEQVWAKQQVQQVIKWESNQVINKVGIPSRLQQKWRHCPSARDSCWQTDHSATMQTLRVQMIMWRGEIMVCKYEKDKQSQ